MKIPLIQYLFLPWFVSAYLDLYKLEISRELQSLLNLFNSCHIKFLLGTPYPQKSSYESSITTLAQYLEPSISISIETTEGSLLTKNHHLARKYSLCFIHGYMTSELGRFTNNILLNRMHLAETSGEQPDHILFFEEETTFTMNYIVAMKLFFHLDLPKTFSTGLAIGIINLYQVYMVCISCYDVDTSVSYYLDSPDMISISNLQFLWNDLHKNLHLGFVDADVSELIIQVTRFIPCDGFARKRTSEPRFATLPRAHMCIHKIFSKILNYSYAGQSMEIANTPIIHGMARFLVFISENNYLVQKHTVNPRPEWLSYAVQYKPFYFITILPKPQLHAMKFIYPFDWIIWLLIFLSGSTLFLFICTVAGLNEAVAILSTIIASSLDQTVSQKFR